VQEEKRKLWRKLNGLHPDRPMVMIDQICWHELNADGSLTLLCEDKECRAYEEELRHKLFQWKHFPVDMVIEPYIAVDKAIRNSYYGIYAQEERLVGDPQNTVMSHKFIDILQTDEDIEKITIPQISHDIQETNRRFEFATEIFGDILPIKLLGLAPMMQMWDPIATLKGVTNALYALVDEPEFVHRVLTKMMLSFTGMIDQLEEQGLLDGQQTLIHCTGAYAEDLPAPGYDPEKPRCKDMWIAGLAQMFSTVSSQMHQEFELDYVNPIFERFGHVYYGCCDPLDLKLDIITKIPNLRKVSMSPWTKAERGAAGLGKNFVFSSKPNPAFLAFDDFDEVLVEKDLRAIKAACSANGTPLEFILKDISTVQYKQDRLDRWAEIAMQVAQE
jgi:hypothetical protein